MAKKTRGSRDATSADDQVARVDRTGDAIPSVSLTDDKSVADKAVSNGFATNRIDERWLAEFKRQMTAVLATYDRSGAEKLCDEYVARTRTAGASMTAQDIASMLGELRKHRHFKSMRRVADAWLQASGLTGEATFKVRRQYVQALIDAGNVAAGLSMAEQLRDEIERTDRKHKEWAEAWGLIGRCHKQAFVETGRSDRLRLAIDAYRQVFEDNRKENYWHGINVVALLVRAERELIRYDDLPYYPEIAQEILADIERREGQNRADAWSRATALEACVALRRPDAAAEWAVRYVHSDYADAFELASTVRQLKEVWQLDSHQEPGNVLLPLLEGELLQRQGGSLQLQARGLSLAKTSEMNAAGQLEKVFGLDTYRNWKWLSTAVERCRAIGRVETKLEAGQGTGFLVRGGDLCARYGDELLFLTNAHVVCDDGKVAAALRSSQAYVRFEVADELAGRRFTIQEILAWSPPSEFDFALARLSPGPTHCLGLPVSTVALRPDGRQRVYAIGYPMGGSLAVSLHDNLLIDFEDPKVHYRTPTNPGSSGSPMFDEQWNLVALHHAGSPQLPRLHGDPGTYEANEGIWITSISRHLNQKHDGPAPSAGSPSAGSPSAGNAANTPGPSNVGLQSRTPPAPVGAGYARTSPKSSSSQSLSPPSIPRGSAMSSSDLLRDLQQYVRQITPEERLDTLRRDMPWESTAGKLESVGGGDVEPNPDAARSALEKIEMGRELDQVEQASLEAIVLPRERPVMFIEEDSFTTPDSPWEHFGTNAKLRANIERAIPSIGRVELPGNRSVPFGGTAFVVGPDLLMTNRHVAELFSVGLGRKVTFRKAAWDYRRERTSRDSDATTLVISDVLMIHPYWDMAILKVKGLTDDHKPLRLSVAAPDSLVDRDVAVIGYPAKDFRNATDIQDRIFKRVYNVKRLQPGKLRKRGRIESFANVVNALTHDSSTLGGNSGSAVIDAATGDVVGLHFAGLYLKANYAVPTYELARDSRVVNAGVNFGGSVRADTTLNTFWRGHESTTDVEHDDSRDDSANRPEASSSSKRPSDTRPTGGTTIEVRLSVAGNSLTIPVTLSASATASGRTERPSGGAEFLEALRPPVIFPSLDTREGYDPSFLVEDGGAEVPLPDLTEAGRRAVAKLDDGSHVLKYHKFSVVMHKTRRLALFTAANVDYRDVVRKINGRKPSRDELTGLGPNDREKWVTDPRIPQNQQLPDRFFTKDGGNFDKGHLVRRDDVAWGETFEDMQMGNGDTFHTTNCSPQTAAFNQSAQGKDNWGDLENLVQQESRAERVIVFSGPVLSPRDDRFEGVDDRGPVRIQIPSAFWKIIVAQGEHGMQAFGFILEQDLSNVAVEFAVPANWRGMMKKISEIEKRMFGLVSFDWLKRHDVRR